MNVNFPSWLTKRMLKDIRGYNLDSYVMALEGWRRGLTLTWYLDSTKVTKMKQIDLDTNGNVFSLANKEETHYFYRSLGDLVTNDVVDIIKNREITKTYLQKADVPLPKSVVLNTFISNDEILTQIKKLNYPLIVKPVLKESNLKTFIEIQNDSQLLDLFQILKNEYDDEEVIVEEYINGENYSLYVVDNEVVSVTKKEPANVIGNGESTIEQLIKMKNEKRRENPYLANKPIKIEKKLIDYLEMQNLALESVLAKDEKIYLNNRTNISLGGDPMNVTEDISDLIKQTAVNAVQAIPSLKHAGLNIIVGKNNEVFIIDINCVADISMHIFPVNGAPKNVPEYIIDYYFPNTKGISQNLTKIYFDYQEVKKILNNKFAQEIMLNDAPKNKLFATRYIVSGKVQKVNYRSWIRKQALKKKLHGYAKNLDNGKVVVVVASDNKDKIKKFKEICALGPSRAKVEDVKELKWNSIIKSGFEIR